MTAAIFIFVVLLGAFIFLTFGVKPKWVLVGGATTWAICIAIGAIHGRVILGHPFSFEGWVAGGFVGGAAFFLVLLATGFWWVIRKYRETTDHRR